VEQIIVVGDPTEPLAESDFDWATLLARTPPEARPALALSADDVAILQYTGGTTGLPKGALGTHGNLVANTLQFDAWIHDAAEHEIILGVLPLFHVYGMVLTLIRAAYQGATLVLTGRRPAEMLEAISQYRPTFFPGVPMIYRLLLDHPGVEARAAELGSIRTCISGAAPLPPEVQQRFEALTGGRLREGYGLSEAPTATHCNPLSENRLGSIGLPLPDIEAAIVDLETGERLLPPDTLGELVVRGPTVMRGYHHQPEATAQALRGGWLYTGDIARMDAQGYFYIVDRKADLINCAGFKVYPSEVERVLREHPAVADVAVAGVPDPYRGEAIKAWVVVKSGMTLNAEELRLWARDQLARYKVPHEIAFVEALPRSAVQKVLRRVLRAGESVD
ncbi:MAG TPA: long-chain fatty acid--CoA ligase, partial [Chloroflexi bacterium]|nr:long-chain fatty acid--CoA ligase [Chloroflexota bacterium]